MALALGACGAMPDWETFRAPDLSIFRPTAVAEMRQRQAVRPVTADDLVGPDGQCAFAAQAPAPESTGSSGLDGAPAVPPPVGIALDMTECEVVRRAGHPERVSIGQNERNERTATLTFTQGLRPGIYHFTAGRLSSMDRAPEPPPPQRRARPARPQQRS